MKAVLLPGNKEVIVADRPIPKPAQGEVLVKLKASAICRSDMSLFYGNPVVGGDAATTGTIIPGHEPAGEVVELGEGAKNVKVGDRVAVYLAIGCGHCHYCKSGYSYLCSEWKCLGFDIDGGDADYMVVPDWVCLKLPDEMSYAAGTLLLDNVGTQYNTQKRLGVSGATTVAMFGIGPMGSAGVLIAKARGARVIAVDLVDHRLEMAKQLGADIVINGASENVVQQIKDLTYGEGVDIAIDASGSPSGQNMAMDCARKQGAVGFIGESKSTTISPSDQFLRKMLTVIGGWYFPIGEYDEIVHFVMQHKINLEQYITHRFPITDAPEAYRLFDEQKTEKAIFVWD